MHTRIIIIIIEYYISYTSLKWNINCIPRGIIPRVYIENLGLLFHTNHYNNCENTAVPLRVCVHRRTFCRIVFKNFPERSVTILHATILLKFSAILSSRDACRKCRSDNATQFARARASFRRRAVQIDVIDIFIRVRRSAGHGFPNSVTFKSDAIDQFADSCSRRSRLMVVVLLPSRKRRDDTAIVWETTSVRQRL